MMENYKQEVKTLLKEKVSKDKLQRQYNYLMDLEKGLELSLDQLRDGFDLRIDKKL